MKGGLCIIYTSLLTISVLSSCALFIIVLSEALHVDEVNTNVDLSGLHNVSKISSSAGKPPEPDPSQEIESLPEEKKTEESNSQMTFPDTLSVNSVTTDGLSSYIFDVTTSYNSMEPAARTKKHDVCGVTSL
ncbi:jg4710 [Pararge aegeria aegeria]|uniref:Jg4710 protein n=1 Tax=Pararge aegeria aegeria TaxID=348720 RepID=A0A8S4RD21_9NEOP|nr:jg4710 [Pararge aegeria aegeria]